MSRYFRAARVAFLASLLLLTPIAARARDDSSPGPSRATIRGTSNGVTIVYRGAPKPRASAAPAALAGAATGVDTSGWVLAEAAELKAGGADDATVVAFLRLHRFEIPAITEGDTVKQLRKAGAGDAVIVALSSLTAVDIGETGEGGFVAYAPAVTEIAAYGNPYDFAGVNGYGGYGGFIPGFGRGARAAMRFDRRGFFPPKHVVAHHGQPPFHTQPGPISGGHRGRMR